MIVRRYEHNDRESTLEVVAEPTASTTLHDSERIEEDRLGYKSRDNSMVYPQNVSLSATYL